MVKFGSKKRSLISIILTLLIVTLLIFSGPVSAVIVSITTNKITYTSDDDLVIFLAQVDIESEERIPVQNLTLKISGPASFSKNCTFTTSGTNLTTCSNLQINPIHILNYSYGFRFGYGYGYGFTSGYGFGNQTFGTGYGYAFTTGYEYTSSSYYSELTYNITWNISAESLTNGVYYVNLEVFAESGSNARIYMNQQPTSFSIYKTISLTWWNSSWEKKRPIDVSTGTTVNDYQLGVNVTYDSDMQSDFDDLRFVNASENAEYPYWIENKSNSNWAYIWIRGNWSSDNGTQAYVYYNNSDVSTTSCQECMPRVLNHDFEGPGSAQDPRNWTITGNAWKEGPPSGLCGSGQEGSNILCSRLDTGESGTGTASSMNFTIIGNNITFLSAGWATGSFEIIRASDNTVLDTKSPVDSDTYSLIFWNVSPYIRTIAYIKVSDTDSGGSYAWQSVDDFHQRTDDVVIDYISPEPTYSIGSEETNLAPQWSNNQSSITTPYDGTKSYFNVTWSDDRDNGFHTALIEMNYSGSPTNYTMSRHFGTNISNYSNILPVGTFYWKVYANDSQNNWNSTDSWVFTINDTTAPTISNVRIMPNTTTAGNNITINATIFDYNMNSSAVFANIWNSSYIFNVSMSNTSSTAYYTIWNSTNASGSYQVNITATDLYNNVNNTLFGSLVISSYAEATYTNNSINITANTTAIVTATLTNTTNVTIGFVTNTSEVGSVTIVEYNSTTDPTISGYSALGKFIEIIVSSNINDTISWYWLNITYTDDEVSGLTESSLRIWFYNTTTNSWQQESNSGVDTTANYVWANITHFTLYGIYGTAAVVAPAAPLVAPGYVTLTLNITGPDSVSIPNGTSKTITLTVGVNILATDVTLNVSGIPLTWVTISPSSADIKAGASQDYTVTISVPAGETARSVVMTFTATSGLASISRDVDLNITVAVPAPYCGDGVCGLDETCENCPEDCGVCPPLCGNAICETGEDYINCPTDCPAPPPPPAIPLGVGILVLVIILAIIGFVIFRIRLKRKAKIKLR